MAGMSRLFDRAWKKGLWIFGGLGFLCCGGLATAGLQVADFPIVARRSTLAERDYRAAGLPWVQADLKMTVAGINGAPSILAGIRLAGDDGMSADEAAIKKDIIAGDWDKAGRRLVKYSGSLAEFKKASESDGFDFERDWDLGPKILFPEFAQLKTASKMLVYRALLSGKNGDIEGALADVGAGYRIGNLVAQEPTLIGMLVGIAVQRISLVGAIRLAALRPDDENWIARVRKEINSWECKTDLLRAMDGEAYMGVATIRNLTGDGRVVVSAISMGEGEDGKDGLRSPDDLLRSGWPSGAVKRAYLVRHLEAHTYFRNELKEANGGYSQVCKKIDEYAKKLPGSPPKLSQVMNAILIPIYSQAGVAADTSYFVLDAADAVLRAAEMRCKTGVYPTFEEIGIEVIDPIDRNRAWYLVKGDQVTVYSIGANGINEKGESTGGADDRGIQFPPNAWK